MTEKVIPLEEAKRRRRRERDASEENCPVTPLGHLAGRFLFLDAAGQRRELAARQLGVRAEVVALFLGDTEWLEKKFPRISLRKEEGETVETVVGFSIAAASEWLMTQCRKQGIWGALTTMRGPGIWTDDEGAPAVHCGDAVWLRGAWHEAGARIDGIIWTTAAPTQRPGSTCGAETVHALQEDLRQLWNFRQPGGEIILLGLVGAALYGAAPDWRPNGFLMGAPRSGKSMLLTLLRALAPLHHYTNDTTKAGLEQALNDRAMPCFIDEAADRVDQRGAQVLMDLVLASTGGEGARVQRGTASGEGRTANVVGAVIMASVAPPALQPQHLSRFTLVELARADAGADHRGPMLAAIHRAKAAGPGVWARALAGWPRYRGALDMFRAALSRAGCDPREMDQLGAVLAGHWVLTEDGVPSSLMADGMVGAISAYIGTAEAVAADDGPRRVLHHLLSSLVPRNRSTELAQIGMLIEEAFKPDSGIDGDTRVAAEVLARYGVRVVRATDISDGFGRTVPRLADGDGVWLGRSVKPLHAIFGDSPFAGDRWLYEVMRAETARASRTNVRIGGYAGRAIWLSRADLVPPDD